MEGSSSQQGRSKTKNRPVGPVQIHTDGKPFGPYYDVLAKHISEHATHCDQFSPRLTWPEQKNAGNVEALYKELTSIFLLLDWSDQAQIAIKFHKWFNDLVRHRFNDNKWRSLYRTYDRCEGDASVHVPERVDSETLVALCQAYEKNAQEDESGKSKKEKRKASRKVNDLDHHMGRDSLSVWCGKFREARNKSPNAKDIYNKEFRKMDALKVAEGELLLPDPRGRLVKNRAEEIGIRLGESFDAAIAEGSDESTASTRAALEAFGFMTRLEMEALRGSRPGRRNTYTSYLEQQVQTLTQRSDVMQRQWDADRQRLVDLERN